MTHLSFDETLLDFSKLTDLGKAVVNCDRQALMGPGKGYLKEFYNYFLILASKGGVHSEFKRARARKQLAKIMDFDLKHKIRVERWEIIKPYLDESGAWKRPLTFQETDDVRAKQRKEKDAQSFIKNDERKQEEKERRERRDQDIRREWGLIRDEKPRRVGRRKAKIYHFPAAALGGLKSGQILNVRAPKE